MKKFILIVLVLMLAFSVTTVFAEGGKVRGEKGIGEVHQYTKSGNGVVSEPIYSDLYCENFNHY